MDSTPLASGGIALSLPEGAWEASEDERREKEVTKVLIGAGANDAKHTESPGIDRLHSLKGSIQAASRLGEGWKITDNQSSSSTYIFACEGHNLSDFHTVQ